MADPNASRGGRAYVEICAGCHQGGIERAPDLAMLQMMSPRSVYRAMAEGVMQIQAEGLSDAEKVEVAEFVTNASLDDAATSAGPPVCEGEAAAFDYNEPPEFTGWGLTPESTHMISTEAAGLTPANVGSLKLKWAFAFPDAIRARAQPQPAAGALYVGSHSGTVFALDRETGCARWTFDAASDVRSGIAISTWQAGDETAKPVAYFGDLTGNIYAVDAITGALKWRLKADPHPAATITATPSLHDGALYVPVSSLEVATARNKDYECCTFRGSVTAYDAETGEQKWQTFTVGEPVPTKLNKAGAQNYGPSGAPVWNTPAIDAKRGQLLIGTGENYSTPASETSDAIYAMDLATGAVNWIYQATPKDAWNSSCGEKGRYNCPDEDGPDFDFGAGTALATDSDGRDYVIAGQKSGMVHALDPDTGTAIWQTKVGRGGLTGGVHFGLAVAAERVLVPISDARDGRTYPEEANPGLFALDLRTGEYLWKAPAADICKGRKYCEPGYAAAISATPELVLAGGHDGHMRIYDAATGAVLWDFDTAKEFPSVGGGTAIGGSFGGGDAPIAYKGKLFVSSGYGFGTKMPGNALLVFEVE